MQRLFWISVFVFTLSLTRPVLSQTLWQENFDVPGKGVWANASGGIESDFTGVEWILNVDSCEFSDENDYAKTVATSGGRFEVLDSDGEVIWMSNPIDISTSDAVNVSLLTNETGGGSDPDKKYIKAFSIVDGGDEQAFYPLGEVSGNWGGGELVCKGLAGEWMQIVVKLNSSYASDKVYFDNVRVEAVDSATLIPTSIKILESSLFAFSGDSVQIRAAALNVNEEILVDSNLVLTIEAADFSVGELAYDNGIYLWKVMTDKTGILNYRISHAENTLAQVDSSILFFSKNDAKLIEDFEETSFQDWNFSTDWMVSNLDPIAGSYSVKHAGDEAVGSSLISHSASTYHLAEEEFFFSFKLKSGNFDPSGSNSFYFWMRSESDSNEGGYAFGVNGLGTTDLFSLWRVENGLPNQLLAETELDWEANTTAQINITRTVQGKWLISVSNLQSGDSKSVELFDDEFSEILDLNLVFNYTTSRAGQLWFDDLVVIGQNAAPFVKRAIPLANNKFQIQFNETVQMDLLSASNFNLKGKSGQEYVIQSIDILDGSNLALNTTVITDPILLVTAKQITDADGKKTDESVLTFENVLPAEEYDILLNEIMADPSPVVHLPDAEYLEIYNRSEKNIQLKDWILFVRNTEWKLPEKLLSPGEYLILCDTEFESEFFSYGNVLPLSGFPSLLNAGVTLRLSDSENNSIESISYSDEWYFDTFKANGGYSLERIDINRFCGQRGNWVASNNEAGGTPGRINSVISDNIDRLSPELLAVDIVSNSELLLTFSEALDSTSAVQISNYSISGLSIQTIYYKMGSLSVSIALLDPLNMNEDYTLVARLLHDECGNQMPGGEFVFSMSTFKPGGILINEVLFNPYTGGSDFVELYNNSGVVIDLAYLKLATRNEVLELSSVLDVSQRHVRFSPGELFVFTKDTLNLLETYNVPHPEQLFQMENFPSFKNDEGRVVVLDDSLRIIDEFAYNENMHSEWLNNYDGVSLERLSYDEETNVASNWLSAASLAGYATPTGENSQTVVAPEQGLEISLESDVVSPNGDGNNDELILQFKLDQTGYLANVIIFDAVGREVRRLANNDLIGNLNELVYDLRDKNGSLLPMGAYVIFTELVHLDVKKKIFKNAFLVTDRQ